MSAPGLLQLSWRPYRFVLPRRLITSRGALVERHGWLLQLRAADGACGWGEAAAPLLMPPLSALAAAVAALPRSLAREELEQRMLQLPAALACAVGMALAELGNAGGCWQRAPRSAWLLPAGEAALAELDCVLASSAGSAGLPITVKWKVAALPDVEERAVLEALLQRLPASAQLRLDANGGWDLATVHRWADRLADEPWLQWLEQPLAPQELAELERLGARLPVALDESLRWNPALRASWPGWQVRRPSQEGDPRPLLAELQAGRPHLMLGTAFETGIGRRWLEHLAALQALGPTPTAPGLAPDWRPEGPLCDADPEQVWASARPQSPSP